MKPPHWILLILATSMLALANASPAFAEGEKCCEHATRHGEHHAEDPAEHHGKQHDMHHGHHAPKFAEIDANGDGGVSAEEFQAFHEARMKTFADEGRKMKHAGKAPAFSELDLDGDGLLSADEFATHRNNCPMHGKHAKDTSEK